MSEEAHFSGEDMQEAAAPTTEAVEDAQAAQSYEEPSQPETVPLAALQAERAQRQKLSEEFQVLRDHVALMQSQNQSKETQKSSFESLPDDDIPTWGEIKKVLTDRERQYQSKLTEMEMQHKYPDYSETINKYLPEVIKQNPRLRDTLQKSQDYELAYYLAKNSESYRKSNKSEKQNSDAQKMIKNSQQAGSLSSMGTTSPINVAKRYKDMSNDDFKKLVNKNMGYVN